MVEQGVVFEQALELDQVEVDVDYVGARDAFQDVLLERLEQLRLTAAAHARDDLDVGCPDGLDQPVQVGIPPYELHARSFRCAFSCNCHYCEV